MTNTSGERWAYLTSLFFIFGLLLLFRIPLWQLTHGKRETGYAFPSRHTLFAASWTLLLVGVFGGIMVALSLYFIHNSDGMGGECFDQQNGIRYALATGSYRIDVN
ncbi:hypothetical protein [Photorhabdus sp. SF281]|uniref:hypothetical protein n=1 Tax=Photorhabdus sp. SF281 TaxID=3459527 RepID=UPI004044BF22